MVCRNKSHNNINSKNNDKFTCLNFNLTLKYVLFFISQLIFVQKYKIIELFMILRIIILFMDTNHLKLFHLKNLKL